MVDSLETFTTGGRVVISFPESAIPQAEKEAFISFLKSEWIARRSRFQESDAIDLSAEVDSSWWSRNRAKFTSRTDDA